MKRPFIQNVPIDFSSVEKMLAEKLVSERNRLANMTLDDDALRDMATFNQLVKDMQATTRMLDVIRGKYATIYGEVFAEPKPIAQTPEDTDIDALAEELRKRQQGEVGGVDTGTDDQSASALQGSAKRLIGRLFSPQQPHQVEEASPGDEQLDPKVDDLAKSAVQEALTSDKNTQTS